MMCHTKDTHETYEDGLIIQQDGHLPILVVEVGSSQIRNQITEHSMYMRELTPTLLL
jgi:hypothetical protein